MNTPANNLKPVQTCWRCRGEVTANLHGDNYPPYDDTRFWGFRCVPCKVRWAAPLSHFPNCIPTPTEQTK